MRKTKTTFSFFSTIIAITALILFSAPISKTEAASIDTGRILDVLKSEQGAAAIQEIIKVGTEIKQGNTSTLKNIAIKRALEEAGIPNQVGELIVDNMQDIGKNLKSEDIVDAATKIAGNAVKEELKARLSERLAPYRDELLILSVLLNKEGLNPQVLQQSSNLTGAPQNYQKIISMSATAYAPGPLDNGIWNDKTYTGGKVKKGVVAVDPNVIPMGTKLYIEGYGHAVALDQGSAIVGNRIDLAFDNRAEALAYGIQDVKVYVLK